LMVFLMVSDRPGLAGKTHADIRIKPPSLLGKPTTFSIPQAFISSFSPVARNCALQLPLPQRAEDAPL